MRSTRKVNYRTIYEYAMANERLSAEANGRFFGVNGKTVRTALKECCRTLEEYEARIANGKRYGKKKDVPGIWFTNGYVRTTVPEWFKGGCERGTAFVHHIVWCEAHGLSAVPRGLEVHHIDGNKLNNDVDNLWAMTPKAHRKLHALEARLTSRR